MPQLDSSEHIEKSYFTIGEVADTLQVNPSLIRFWEKEFPQLKPRKTEGGTRKYSLADMDLLRRIHRLVKTEGFTLAGAREKLKENNTAGNLEDVKNHLVSLRQFLTDIKNQLP